jgi:predicted lipoprotein with Yx(FWY)xxD motif
MKTLFTLGAVIAMAALLAACGGSSGENAATAASSSGGGIVSVAEIGEAGPVLVDSSGQALYASDQETESGMVLCSGACNSFWKPLTVSGGAPMTGPVAAHLGVAKRPDGSRQVTYKGKLLYTFTQEEPGEVTGDGFQDSFEGHRFTWHVVTTGGSAGSATGSSTETSRSSGGYGY